jgi:hypothetical protein
MPRFPSRISSTLLLVAIAPSAAAAAPVTLTGPTALAVAAVVAPHSPHLGRRDSKVIARLFEGDTKVAAKKKITVAADAVTCRISNVAIAERSCELSFGNSKRTIRGREANEVFATLASAGVTAEGAAGSMIEAVTKLECTLDPAGIRQNDGSGAECSLQTAE